jgi:hypothetical protein
MKKLVYKIGKILSMLFALPFVILIRLISPFYLIRFGYLISHRIGHFVANTEIYLCEKDEKINCPINLNYIDIFFLAYEPICNKQLSNMWRRKLNIFPRKIIQPLYVANKLIPGFAKHEISANTQEDRDVHNLMKSYSPHLSFTQEEEKMGNLILEKLGVPENSKFVCLIVRDDAYLNQHMGGSFDYHNYRDCNILNYIKAAEYLANQGIYVIRMGAVVKNKLVSKNIKIIDYATNGMRTDFMDIYLGAKCYFCISSSLGWDAIPEVFNRPIVYTNILPFGFLRTHGINSINL